MRASDIHNNVKTSDQSAVVPLEPDAKRTVCVQPEANTSRSPLACIQNLFIL